MDNLAFSDALSRGNGQKRVRDELRSLKDDVDFIDAARKYLFHMKNIFFVNLLNQLDDLDHFIHFYAALKCGIRGAPEAETLVLFKNYQPPSDRAPQPSRSG